MKSVETPVANHRVVTREEWLTQRRALLVREKEFTRQREELSRQRRELPWVKVDRTYIFEGPDGKESLFDLFAGRSQLIVYHFMLGSGWKEGCPGCSFVSDHIDGALPHLAARDVTLVAVSRATPPEIEAFKRRMGWRFKWVSSHDNSFNHDYRVSFTKDELARGEVVYNFESKKHDHEELPGASVFFKDEAGDIYHTYSTYARGLESLVGTYSFLDLAPKGRDEDRLSPPMSWVRHHDRYENAQPRAVTSLPAAASKACCKETAS